MKKVLKIDADGIFITDVILQDDKIVPADCIESQCPEGFYKPKWNGDAWIEGLAQAEIDVIKTPKPQPPTIHERIDAVEFMLIDLLNFM